jgi:hypothetical protein
MCSFNNQKANYEVRTRKEENKQTHKQKINDKTM